MCVKLHECDDMAHKMCWLITGGRLTFLQYGNLHECI